MPVAFNMSVHQCCQCIGYAGRGHWVGPPITVERFGRQVPALQVACPLLGEGLHPSPDPTEGCGQFVAKTEFNVAA